MSGDGMQVAAPMATKTGAVEKKSAKREGRRTPFRIVLFSWRCQLCVLQGWSVFCRWPSKAAEAELLAESAMLLKHAGSRGVRSFATYAGSSQTSCRSEVV